MKQSWHTAPLCLAAVPTHCKASTLCLVTLNSSKCQNIQSHFHLPAIDLLVHVSRLLSSFHLSTKQICPSFQLSHSTLLLSPLTSTLISVFTHISLMLGLSVYLPTGTGAPRGDLGLTQSCSSALQYPISQRV